MGAIKGNSYSTPVVNENENETTSADKNTYLEEHTMVNTDSREKTDSIDVHQCDDSDIASLENDEATNLHQETKLLRDTLDLLWNQTLEQRNMCEQLEKENEYLQDYINNLMTSSNVLDK